MKAALLLLAAVFMASPAPAGEWQTIFDGKTLAGWKANSENPAAFLPQPDGSLKVTGKRGHLFYVGADGKAAFSNFELALQVKTTPGSNSGVYFHTEYQDRGWPAAGYEVQVNSSHKDPRKTGSLYAVVDCFLDPEADPPFVTSAPDEGVRLHMKESPSRDDEWFDYHISVVGRKITIKVNGATTVEFTEPEGWRAPRPDMSGRKLGKGTLALQAHDPKSTVFYRNIRLKVLD